MREVVSTHPQSPMRWTLLGIIGYILMLVLTQNLFQGHLDISASWNAILNETIFWFIPDVIFTYIMGALATLALRKQSLKSWGVDLPKESSIWGLRPGIWVGAFTSYVLALIILLLASVTVVLLPQHHTLLEKSSGMTIGLISMFYFCFSVAYYYGIPKKRYIVGYVALPIWGLTFLGIMMITILTQGGK